MKYTAQTQTKLIQQQSFHDTIDKLKAMYHKNDGILHIGDDGIARSFDGKGNVIAAIRMSKDELYSWADAMGDEFDKTDLRAIWDKADPDSVEQDGAFQPAKELMPPKFTDPEGFQASFDRRRSENPQESILSELSRRADNNYCLGRRCTTTTACQFMGCQRCLQLDLSALRTVCV